MSEHIDLGKPVGPLPLGGWFVVVGGGLAAGLYLRHRAALATPPAPTTDPNYADNGAGAAVSDPTNPPTNLPTPYSSGGPSGLPVSGHIGNNNDWRRQAVAYLIGLGHTAISAERAVAKYLAGQRLSQRQGAMVNSAVAGLGTTPTPVPMPEVNPGRHKPAPAPQPPTHGGHHHRPGNGPRPVPVHDHPHGPHHHRGPARNDTGRGMSA